MFQTTNQSLFANRATVKMYDMNRCTRNIPQTTKHVFEKGCGNVFAQTDVVRSHYGFPKNDANLTRTRAEELTCPDHSIQPSIPMIFLSYP